MKGAARAVLLVATGWCLAGAVKDRDPVVGAVCVAIWVAFYAL